MKRRYGAPVYLPSCNYTGVTRTKKRQFPVELRMTFDDYDENDENERELEQERARVEAAAAAAPKPAPKPLVLSSAELKRSRAPSRPPGPLGPHSAIFKTWPSRGRRGGGEASTSASCSSDPGFVGAPERVLADEAMLNHVTREYLCAMKRQRERETPAAKRQRENTWGQEERKESAARASHRINVRRAVACQTRTRALAVHWALRAWAAWAYAAKARRITVQRVLARRDIVRDRIRCTIVFSSWKKCKKFQ